MCRGNKTELDPDTPATAEDAGHFDVSTVLSETEERDEQDQEEKYPGCEDHGT
jgi:hypothetical protein